MKNIQRQVPSRMKNCNLNYRNAKAQLINDFNNRCGYCDDSAEIACCSFHIDHFAPQKKFPALINEYNNFVYSCPYCNNSKSDKWVSTKAEISFIDDKGFIDPCNPNYNTNFERLENGKIIPLTDLAQYMYFELKLYLKRHEILYLIEEIDTRCELIKEKIKKYKSEGKNTDKLEKIELELLRYFRQYCLFYRKAWNSGV